MSLHRSIIRALLLAAGLAALAACSHPAKMSSSESANRLVARVNGHPIRQGVLDTFLGITKNAPPQLSPMIQNLALQRLIDIQILAQKGRESGLLRSPQARDSLFLQRQVLLANLEIRHYLKTHPITPAQLKTAYAKTVGRMGHHEYKARHILVKTQSQARTIIVDLEHGQHFSTLAKKYSEDTTAAEGGELGWVSASQETPPFAAALRQLKVGQYTRTPVKTQFGWHVIQLQGKRPITPPSFKQMHNRLLNVLRNKEVSDFITHLRSHAKVKILLKQTPIPTGSTAVAPAKP
jgi:peptidyl-prolyl cis-trans isomerase C